MHRMNSLGEHPYTELGLPLFDIGQAMNRLMRIEDYPFLQREMSLEEGTYSCDDSIYPFTVEGFLNSCSNLFPLCFQKRIDFFFIVLQVIEHGQSSGCRE